MHLCAQNVTSSYKRHLTDILWIEYNKDSFVFFSLITSWMGARWSARMWTSHSWTIVWSRGRRSSLRLTLKLIQSLKNIGSICILVHSKIWLQNEFAYKCNKQGVFDVFFGILQKMVIYLLPKCFFLNYNCQEFQPKPQSVETHFYFVYL